MALNAYLKATSPSRGWIKGSVTQKGREGLIKVVRVDHPTERPLDPASFSIIGPIHHRPLLIAKEIDAATIGLRGCFIDNETFSEWRLQFWRPQLSAGAGGGVEVQHFTIELTGARVQAIRHVLPDTRDPAFTAWQDFEEVAFVYEKIKWTWTTGNKSVSDEVGHPPKARLAIPRPKRKR